MESKIQNLLGRWLPFSPQHAFRFVDHDSTIALEVSERQCKEEVLSATYKKHTDPLDESTISNTLYEPYNKNSLSSNMFLGSWSSTKAFSATSCHLVQLSSTSGRYTCQGSKLNEIVLTTESQQRGQHGQFPWQQKLNDRDKTIYIYIHPHKKCTAWASKRAWMPCHAEAGRVRKSPAASLSCAMHDNGWTLNMLQACAPWFWSLHLLFCKFSLWKRREQQITVQCHTGTKGKWFLDFGVP